MWIYYPNKGQTLCAAVNSLTKLSKTTLHTNRDCHHTSELKAYILTDHRCHHPVPHSVSPLRFVVWQGAFMQVYVCIMYSVQYMSTYPSYILAPRYALD